MGERTRYEPGTFCWVGLATSDPAAGRAFYTNLFDWQAEALSAGEAGTFTLLRRDGSDVAILLPAAAAGASRRGAAALDLVRLRGGCGRDRSAHR
jgi:predicted enzyme related to lactoylglutathione lyase